MNIIKDGLIVINHEVISNKANECTITVREVSTSGNDVSCSGCNLETTKRYEEAIREIEGLLDDYKTLIEKDMKGIVSISKNLNEVNIKVGENMKALGAVAGAIKVNN